MQFSLHDAADCHDVTTDARINQVILDLTVDGLRHLACIHIFDVVLNLLDPQPLKETSLRRVLLRVEDSRATVQADTPVWRLPLAIHEGQQYLRLAVVALKLNRFNQHFDRANSQHSAPQAHELIDEVGLDLRQWEHLSVVEKSHHHKSLILFLLEDMQPYIVERQTYRPYDILWVLRNKFKELLDVLWAGLIQ